MSAPTAPIRPPRVALITGAGAGIGRGLALTFAEAGYDLALCDIDAESLAETGRRAASHHAKIYAQAVDLRRVEQIESFVNRAVTELGALHVLINNAGVMLLDQVQDVRTEQVDAMLAVNLRAAILLSRTVVPHLQAAGGGVILHMASVHAHNGHARASVYAATKGALVALARSQAVELAPSSIRVNSVSPGTVDSPMLHAFLREHASDPARGAAAFAALHPRGQLASIDEVARCFLFLASEAAANVTGVDLRCDGGYCIQGFQPTH